MARKLKPLWQVLRENPRHYFDEDGWVLIPDIVPVIKPQDFILFGREVEPGTRFHRSWFEDEAPGEFEKSFPPGLAMHFEAGAQLKSEPSKPKRTVTAYAYWHRNTIFVPDLSKGSGGHLAPQDPASLVWFNQELIHYSASSSYTRAPEWDETREIK